MLKNVMQSKMFSRRAAALSLLLLGVGVWVQAGELNPPTGAIQATGRQIINQQYFISALPYVISQPGSYVLTSDLNGVSGQNGIEVQADDVTIDLNGFALIGVTGSLDGINAGGFHDNLTIINGLLRDWDGAGVNSNTANCHVRFVRAHGNGSHGLRVGGGAEISHCVSNGNGGAGIRTSGGSTISFCTANSNDGIGIDSGGTVIGCNAGSNGGDGINIAGDGLVKNCRTVGNNRGITTGVSGTYINCVVEGSTGDGVVAGVGAAVVGCTVRFTGGNGITVEDGSTVRDCTVRSSTGDGILVTADCQVTGNTCDDGDAAGIHATGDDNRIDGNSVTNNARGIEVDVGAVDNLVIRNSARANTTNYSVPPAANQVGPIHNAAGTIPGVLSAWANFAR